MKCLWNEEFSDRGPNFSTMCNSFKLRPKHLFKGAENFPALPIYGHAYLGTNCAPVLHLPRQTKPFQQSQSKVLCTKERDDIRLQTENVRAPVVFGLYCPTSQILMKKFCMKSR